VKYKLTTLKDVFELVPADRIKACLLELATAMERAKAMRELLELVGSAVTEKAVVCEMQWPESVTWIDDGAGELGLVYRDDSGVLIRQDIRTAGAAPAPAEAGPQPCPFCGKEADMNDPDTLYPSGSYWRDAADVGIRTYHGARQHQEGDGVCWAMHCPTPAGGCGAEITGDSKEEAIAAWDRRPNLKTAPERTGQG
jgi:hypothetical protein